MGTQSTWGHQLTTKLQSVTAASPSAHHLLNTQAQFRSPGEFCSNSLRKMGKCSICKGTGKSQCGKCKGKGTFSGSTCSNCKGSGRGNIKCGHCKGTGNKQCSHRL